MCSSDLLNQLYDLMDALGPFNISGNAMSAAGSLQVAKESGTVFSRGFNHFADDALTDDPHVSSVDAQNPMTMRYVTQTPQAPVATVTSVSPRSEEHTSELQSLMRNSYAVFCLKKKK